MKLLLVSLNYAPEQTGIGKYQAETASWFAARGHEVRVIAAPPYYPAWSIQDGYSGWRYARERMDMEGVSVYRVPLYVPHKPSGLKRLVHLASFAVSSLPVILYQAIFWRPHAIVLTEPPLMAAPAVLLSGLLSGAGTYLHVHDYEVDAAFELGLLNKPALRRFALRMEKMLLSAFARVSTISPRMLDKLWEKGVAKEKTRNIPNWSNVHDFDGVDISAETLSRYKADPSCVLAVYSGNLGRKQGLETIVEAARLLKGHRHLRFIVSGDGAGRADMELQAQGLDNITFLPVQPKQDFIQLMMVADIHLLPQKAGAADLVMPSKLGNILASGRPVVAGAEAGTQVYDAVRGCGLLAPPENAAAFASALETLAGDQELRKKLGQAGRARALEQWSKESSLGSLEEWLSCR